ncbi:hypothetical protein NLG97_g2916 [Lecanicillium saksenae]|uniref:Uncharacterized protein n=1 Tax=Lecanicillium saksenae TaxID=468837 RepID=A0ACC1R2Y1_9HYPO|nr:hypothetical protein NLG97_g2916 [Lecanicillium saksenae]
MNGNFEHVENLTPSNFVRKRRISAQAASTEDADRVDQQKAGKAVFPPTLPSRLRSLLLPAGEQIAATKCFVAWITALPPFIIETKREVLPEFLHRCEILLRRPFTSTDAHCHPLCPERRSYTTSFVVNLVLQAANDVIEKNFQTPRSVNQLLIQFLHDWSRPSTSGPVTTTEALIGSRGHAILLFNTGNYEAKDLGTVKHMAAVEPEAVKRLDTSIFDRLAYKALRRKLLPAMEGLPTYGLLELYPLSKTDEMQCPTQQEMQQQRVKREQQERLSRDHDDAKAEVVACKASWQDRPDENLFPSCHTFMKKAMEHLRSTEIECKGTFRLSSRDLQNPISEQYLLRMGSNDGLQKYGSRNKAKTGA